MGPGIHGGVVNAVEGSCEVQPVCLGPHGHTECRGFCRGALVVGRVLISSLV